MITTYNNGRYLRDALESVLAEDAGPERMQIEVIDGGSTQDDPEPLVRELGRDRVVFHRLLRNRGAAATFNACIDRSRGHWVHILHGDDLVCPGFYEEYDALMRSYPDANMIVGQTILIDEDRRWLDLIGPIPPPGGGPLSDLLERLATCQQVQFPGVVVRRSAYERVGGFCPLFTHACDWDMWFRVAQLGPVICTGRPYALYRRHRESDASQMAISGGDVRETYLVAKLNLARIGRQPATVEASMWQRDLAARAETKAWVLDRRGCFVGRWNQARWAWLLDPGPHRLRVLVTSWLKHQLRSTHADGGRADGTTGTLA